MSRCGFFLPCILLETWVDVFALTLALSRKAGEGSRNTKVPSPIPMGEDSGEGKRILFAEFWELRRHDLLRLRRNLPHQLPGALDRIDQSGVLTVTERRIFDIACAPRFHRRPRGFMNLLAQRPLTS